jgi:uncharacterized membrane protein
MLVTAATLALPFTRPVYIRFGILHFLGAAMALAWALERLVPQERARAVAVRVAAPLSFALGLWLSGRRTSLPFLFPLGLVTESFQSYDYYPLFPWLGAFFAGLAAAPVVRRNRDFLARVPLPAPARPLAFLGRHSLAVYLAHQPLMLGAIFVAARFLAR